jgi:hypothetical protein
MFPILPGISSLEFVGAVEVVPQKNCTISILAPQEML